MMAKSRKPSLFDDLSRQLATFAPNLAGLVACPICLRLFSEDDYRKGILTNGHVIPKALGAKRIILLCLDCNGQCSATDKHLTDYVRVMFGARPGARVKAVEVQIDGNSVTGSLSRNPPGSRNPYSIKIVPRAGDMPALRRAADYLRPFGDKRIEIQWGFKPREVNVAFLTSAYLEAFRLRGYWFILNSNLNVVRQQILEPRSGNLVDFAVREWDLGQPRVGRLRLVSQPESSQCFSFSMFGKTAILPKAEDRTGRVYRDLSKYLAAPFSEYYDMQADIIGGRVDLEMEARTHTKSVAFAHPDLETVRRLDPAVSLDLDWIRDAPNWAAPLIIPKRALGR